jgi:hypothetical protein
MSAVQNARAVYHKLTSPDDVLGYLLLSDSGNSWIIVAMMILLADVAMSPRRR